MRKSPVGNQKLYAIQGILSNQTYMEDSGLYQHLKEHLSTLPAQVLGDLHFLINLKVEQAVDEYKALEIFHKSHPWAAEVKGDTT